MKLLKLNTMMKNHKFFFIYLRKKTLNYKSIFLSLLYIKIININNE